MRVSTMREVNATIRNRNRWSLSGLGLSRFVTCLFFALAAKVAFGQAPTSPTSSILLTPLPGDNTELTITWSGGNGTNRIVIVGTLDGSYVPTNGVASPGDNNNFTSGANITQSAGTVKCVYNGNALTVTVDNLTSGTNYFVRVYEYNGSGASTMYNFTANANNPQAFSRMTASGNFSVPANVGNVAVRAWGGGGGGGGANSDNADRQGGGGGGGAFQSNSSVSVAGPTVAVVIGAGGAGGIGTTASQTEGGNGGATTFGGTLVTANGGTGGQTAKDAGPINFGAGGAGGTGTFNGGSGEIGTGPNGGGVGGGGAGSTANGANGTAGGAGGTAGGGNGGASPSQNNDGNPGQYPSGGGSGARQTDDTSRDGGAGAPGFMVITWAHPIPVVSIFGPSTTNGTPVFQVVFTKPINTGTFIGSDVTLSAGTAPGTLSAAIAEIAPNDGTTFTITVSGMTGAGTVIASLAADVVDDTGGNKSTASNTGTTITYVHDVVGPTPTISVSGPTPTNVNPIFQVVFNEPITISSFIGTDVTLTGTAAATTAVIAEIAPNDGTTFTITATGMAGTGTVIANIAAGVVTDRAATPNTNLISNAGTTIDYDITPPPTPSIPNLDAASDTGSSSTDDNTNDNTPTFTVTGTAGMLLEILDGGAVVGSIVAGSVTGGAQTITTSTLADGVNRSITARTTDGAGNTASSVALLVTIDTAPPAAPATPDLTAATDSGQSNTDNNTNDNTPDFSGSGTDGFTITIRSDAVSVGSAVVSGGTYTVTTSIIADGLARLISATTTDIAGNTSGPSADLSVVIDTAPPGAPSAPDLQAGSDSGSSSTDDYTNDNTPSFDASGTSTFKLELIDGASTVVATIPSASGGTQTLTSSVLADGPHTMKARTTDVAGNFTDGPTLNITIDTALPATPTVPNLQAGSDSGSSNTDDNTTDTTPTFDITGSAGLLLELLDGGVVVGSIASASGGSEAITSSALTDGLHNMSARTTDLAGNTATSANLPVTIDTAFPDPSTIVANTVATPINAYAPAVNGVTTPPTNSVVFRVTFNDGVTGVDMSDFNVNTNGPAFGGVTVTPFSSSIYDVSVNGLTGTGTVNIDLIDDNSIADLAGNLLGGGAVNDGDLTTTVALGNNQFFTLALPQPSGAVSTLNIPTVTSNSIDVSWTDVAAAQAPTHYLVMLKTAASSYDAFADGTLLADDFDLSDGDLKVNVAQGVGMASFAVNSGVDYDVIIYPYTLHANSIVLGNTTTINYFTSTPATNSASTPTATQTLLSAGNGVATISSLDTSAPSFRAVFTFTVQDDGTNPGDDDAPFKFSTLTINADNANGNSIMDWSQAIANTNVRLSDNFAHSQTANITVNAGSIVISSIGSSSAADLGYIPDNTTKIYTLEVFLRSSLLGSLPQTIDGLQFVMDVDEFDFGYNDTGILSSRIRPGETQFSGIGNGVVTVVATHLNFTTQPPSTPYVLTNIVSVSAAPDFSTTPVVRARDINGNTDLGFNNTITITNTASIPMVNLVPANTLAVTNGVGTFPVNFQYSDDGNGTLIPAFGGLTGVNSSAVTVIYDNNNRIIAGGGAEPATISSLSTGPGFVTVFDFTIVDDNGAGGDGASTRFSQLVITQPGGNDIADWTQAIASARLVQGISIMPGTVNATNITFAGIPNLIGTEPGHINDNASKTYTLQIFLRSTMGGTLAQTIDNLNFNFNMSEVNVLLIASSSSDFSAPGTQATNSGSLNNAVNVVATTLRFATNPNSTLLVQKDINLQAPVNVPVIRAEDANNNTDLDYAAVATITCALTVSPSVFLSPVAGVYTYPGNFRYTETGDGTMSVNSGIGLANSNPVSVVAANATTISGGSAPATISSLSIAGPPGVPVFSFIVTDDASGPGPNDDGLPTLMSQIIIRQNLANDDFTDWTQAIAGARLTDNLANVAIPTAISATSITFGGLSTAAGQIGHVGDNAAKTYTLSIWLRNPLLGTLPIDIDGKQFEFQVTQGPDIVLATNSSIITNAETETSGSNNMVTVIATTMRFTSPIASTSVPLDTDISGYQVEAVDALNNRDLGFSGVNGLVTQLTNQTSATMTGTPAVGTQFVNGLLDFGTFRFTSGNSGDFVTLNVRASDALGETTCGTAGCICATSPVLTLLSSFESIVMGDPTYSYSPEIQYVNFQASDINLSPSSVEISRVLLIDGSRQFFNYLGFPLTTGTNIDAFANADEDGAETKLNSITFNITNPGTLRRLALYSGAVELGEINVQMMGLSPADTDEDFTFAAAPLATLIAAADDNLVPLSLRASFMDTAPLITDGDLINVRVAGALLLSGSNFFAAPAPSIAGITNGFASPGGNRLNVAATKLDFVDQPGATAGKNEPVLDFAIVHARNQFNVLDTDWTHLASVSSQGTANVQGSFSFTAGVLSTNGLLTYGGQGIGTLTVTSTGGFGPTTISSLTNQPAAVPPNVAVQCTRVDVIHVGATRVDGGVGGVPPGPDANVNAGTQDQPFLGFQFVAPYTFANNPKISSFTITFNSSYAGILTGFQVLESPNTSFTNALPVVGTVTPNGTNAITVDLSAAPRDLSLNPNITFFLLADIEVAVGGGTTPLQARLIDGGVGSGTEGNIIVQSNIGSQLSTSLQGPLFSFASVAPPTLLETYPRIGQTNLDPTQPTIELTFSVPVFSLDHEIELWRKGSPDVLVATLMAANGTSFDPSSGFDPIPNQAAKPIVFDVPALTMAANQEYYVLVAPGSLGLETGICDASRNLYQGITSPGTFFFRTSGPLAPSLLGQSTVPAATGDPTTSNLTNEGATINATFDRLGEAYYIVTSSDDPTAPTSLQIRDEATGTNTGYPDVVAAGIIDINATHTITQSGTFAVPGGFTNTRHYVWITAAGQIEKKVGAAILTTSTLASAPFTSGPTFAPVGVDPTFFFDPPAPAPNVQVRTNNVTIGLCSNSFQILNTPIIIYEGTGAGQQFFSGLADRTINLLLPGGFELDVSEDAMGNPIYGAVDLIGTDFSSPTGTIEYITPSMLRVIFTNNNSLSKDQIIIRGLRVKSNGALLGNIIRLGGTGITALNDGDVMARISASEVPPIKFDNSYSISLGDYWGAPLLANQRTETAIPDNINPPEVQLIPYIINSYDFGPTTFAGQGVILNELRVNGVPLDFPFNITVTHTDQNGCISDNNEQFVVYNDAFAVKVTNPLVNNPANVPVTLDQGPYCAKIDNFAIGQQLASSASPGIVRDVFYTNIDAYYMLSLTAQIPPGLPPQIMSGPDWDNIVENNLLYLSSTQPLPILTIQYSNYQFDDKTIVNAHASSAGAIPYVYDNFIDSVQRTTNPNYPFGIKFYKGGSLGFIELTGKYNNISNPAVQINRRQLLEFVLPAVPAIEMVTPASELINGSPAFGLDPINTPSYPFGTTSSPANPNNPGTFVYCEGGGLITINGHPRAEPTRGETGVFRIYQGNTATPITTGITTFSNGVVQLDPGDGGIQNGNQTIRVEYEFTDGRGICSGIGVGYLRVTPNPTAAFTMTSVADPFIDASNPTAYCAGKLINYDPSASTISGGGATLQDYTWVFDDNDTSALVNPQHSYLNIGPYSPALQITSNYGCKSNIATVPINVGGIPLVNMEFDGTHVSILGADPFSFRNNNSVISINDNYKRLDIDYGDGDADFYLDATPSAADDILFSTYEFLHPYLSSGRKVYDFRITTALGCVNSLSLTNTLIIGIQAPFLKEDSLLRTLVVLPRFKATPSNAYLETFDIGNGVQADTNRIWQSWYTGAFKHTPVAPETLPKRSVDPTWQKGIPVGKFQPTVNGDTVWTTRLNGTYDPKERSALYSPSFDLSELTRPMISFDTYTSLEAADGVVVQYSIDNKNIVDPTKVWLTLGSDNDGENWYTDRGIAAKPGDQIGNDYGWSRKDSLKWLSSRHALTDDSNVIITNSLVVFRLALAGEATAITGDGFGFDNVRIGERTRTILLESFGNTANTTLTSATTPPGYLTDEEYEAYQISLMQQANVGLEVVKLNYRVNFPGNDPLNQNNAGDPSSRALFYNIDRTPAARLDGYAPSPYTPFSQWGNTNFATRTLRLAQAAIYIRAATGLPTDSITNAGKIRFFVDIKPTVNLGNNTILHLGIIEQVVPVANLSTNAQTMVKTGETSFEYVLKKLLPSASGTRISTHPDAVGGALVPKVIPPPTPADTVYTFGPFEWIPESSKFYGPSIDDLGVIAFLQREDGDKEVYQAEIILDLDDPDGSLVTGVEPLSSAEVKVYPNPANQEMTVMLPAPLAKQAGIQLIDQTGRSVLKASMPEGSDRKTLNVSDLSGGMYILTIDMGQGTLTRKKVMIVHQD